MVEGFNFGSISAAGSPTVPARSGDGRAPPRRRPGLGIIGVGAFGAFAVPHLQAFFDIGLCDPDRDLTPITAETGARSVDLATAAAQDVVLLAVPLSRIRPVAAAIAPHLRPGSLVVDVCSVKATPLRILAEVLPPGVGIVGTHPLFGPQSGRDGIRGLRIAVCPVRGRRTALLVRFLRRRLGLHVIRTTAEEHDRQMAFVQGLTHLIARIVVAMDVPPLDHTTTTFDHLMRMVATVRDDSDELFRTITAENAFAGDVRRRFLAAVEEVTGG